MKFLNKDILITNIILFNHILIKNCAKKYRLFYIFLI